MRTIDKTVYNVYNVDNVYNVNIACWRASEKAPTVDTIGRYAGQRAAVRFYLKLIIEALRKSFSRVFFSRIKPAGELATPTNFVFAFNKFQSGAVVLYSAAAFCYSQKIYKYFKRYY